MSTTFFDFQLIKPGHSSWESSLPNGHFKKQLLIFFEAPPEQADELNHFLGKILKAIQLNLQEDTLFVNKAPGHDYAIADLLAQRAARQVLIFGIPPTALGIRFALPPYHNVIHRNTGFLWADDLATIFAERQQGGKKMSGQLWQAIQQFSL